MHAISHTRHLGTMIITIVRHKQRSKSIPTFFISLDNIDRLISMYINVINIIKYYLL